MRADQVIRTVNAEWSVWKVIGKSSGLAPVIEVNLEVNLGRCVKPMM